MLLDSLIGSNRTEEGRGGGVYSSGTLRMVRSTVDSNISGGTGGGVFHCCAEEDTLTVNESTFVRNEAASAAAIWSAGLLRLVNTTITENTAMSQGAVTSTGVANLVHVTLVRNAAGAFPGLQALGTGTVTNSIIDHCNSSSAVLSGGGNVEDGSDTCGFNDATDSTGVDAGLGLLGTIGVPTVAWSLEENSPAIHAAVPRYCPAWDQRGLLRAGGGVVTQVR